MGDLGLPFMVVLVGFVGLAFGFVVSLFARRAVRAAPVAAVAFVVAGALVATLGARSLSKPEPDSSAAVRTNSYRRGRVRRRR